MTDKISDLIFAANQKLIDFNCGISIEQRGKRLSLRGTLPPKPNSRRQKPHQQYLSLGIFANPDGIKFAIKEAKKVGALNACGEFDWSPYLQRRSPTDLIHWGIFIDPYLPPSHFTQKTKGRSPLDCHFLDR